jgi:hypothetical protein
MANMQPDIVLRRGTTELIVAVAVAHPCEDEKLALK